MSVDTKSVAGRRELHFESYRELLDDVRSLAARPRRQLGNWTLGQICQHLAGAIDMAVDGPSFKPPFFLRLIGPLLKKRFLKRFPPGYKVPPGAGSLIPGTDEDAVGVAALEKAVARLEATPERKPHVLFGRLSREEWDQFEFRHAEMHLSFIVPQ
ncbi:MAG: DUF1569 domain-containing protein [Pirellulales bacterium]